MSPHPTPSPHTARFGRAALTVLATLAAASLLPAANLIWDPANATNGSTIDAGNGTWDTTAGNLVWNNAGTNVAWTQNSSSNASNSAQFAGADAPVGTSYVITVGTSVAVTSPNNALWFANSGYVLTSNASRVITTPQITVSTGKTATLSGNITVTPASNGALTLGGFGNLTVTDGARLAPNSNNLVLNHGNKLTLKSGGVATTLAQIVFGSGTANATLTQVSIEGGIISSTATSTSNATNIVIANVGSGTANATVTLSSGSLSNSSPIGGLRFGPGTGGVATVTGTLNLDGGNLTTARIYEGTGSALGTVSTFNFNGGTLKAVANTTNGASFMASLDNAFVKGGGAIIDTNGAAITIAQPLLTDTVSTGGGLTKLGNGTLTLTGSNTYTGNTTIAAGTLAINAPYSALTATSVEAGARLRITSGTTASTLSSLIMKEGSAIELNLGVYNSSRVSSASFTTLDASGNFTVDLAGTNILVGNYTILTYGSKSGSGVPVVGLLPPGVTATVQDTGSDIVLSVLTPQVPNYFWSAGSGVWDTTTANWNSLTYAEGSVATFSDLAGDNTVTLSASRSPFSVEIQNNAGNTYTFNGSSITGPATIWKTGNGTATLAAANSYTGNTTVSAGALIVSADGALGTTDGSTTLASGSFLGLSGGVTYSTAETVFGAGASNTAAIGSLIAQRGIIQSVSGNNTFAGNLTLNATGTTRIGVQDGASLTLSGTIAPAAGVTGAQLLVRAGLDGDFVTLSGTGNSWSSPIQIFAGATSGHAGLRLGANNSLPVDTSVVAGGNSAGAGTTFDLAGFSQTLNGLPQSNGNLTISNSGNTLSTLTLDLLTADATSVPGTGGINLTRIEDGTGTGKVALVKKGTFTQTLTGAHSYTGNTTIEAGTLAFTGLTSLGSTTVSMVSGSTLNILGITANDFTLSAGLAGSGNVTAGNATITKTLIVDALFQPGALSITGNLTLNSGTASTFVATSSPATTSTTVVTGALINNGTLAINVAEGFTFATGQSITFATATGGITTGFTGVSVTGQPLAETTPDVWTASIDGLDFTYNETTATLVVSGGIVITPLQTWRNTYFPGAGNDGTGIGALEADPDGDGLNNLLEYATGTIPTAANPSAVTSGTVGGKLTLTFNRTDDPKLAYDVQGRSDLVTGIWTSVSATTPPLAGGSTPVTVEDDFLITAQPKRFLRLQITLTP